MAAKDRLLILLRHLDHGDAPVNTAITCHPTSAVISEVKSIDYVLNNSVLTKEQTRFYEKNGFLVIPKLVSQEEIDKYRNVFEALCTGEMKAPFGLTIMRDVSIAKSEFVAGKKAITKIQNFQNVPELMEYCALPEVTKYAKAFIGPNIMAMHTMLINKPPDPGTKSSRHPMHQDLYYFPFRPAERIVCSWTAMEKVHRKNGCLVVLPGTHRGEMLEHGYPKWEGGVNKMYHGILDYSPDQPRVHLEMEAGDTVFFHPLLIHGSGMNRTDGFRKSISCHYASSDCQYIDTSGSIQDFISDEMTSLVNDRMKKRGIKDYKITFADIWRMKGRLVHGREGTLT